MRKSISTLFLVVGAAFFGGAVVAVAGPIFSEAARVEDNVKSLARLQQIDFVIEVDSSEAFKAAGISGAAIRRKWKRRLKDAGLVVTSDPQKPVLALLVSSITDPAVRNGVAFDLYLALVQKARVDQIGELWVQTYVEVRLGLETKQKLRQSVEESVDEMIGIFVDHWQESRRDTLP